MEMNFLIRAAQQGDLDAFNQIILAYQDLLYSQAFHLLGNRESAEDAVQEALILAFRGLGSFRGGSLRAWLVRIVTNLCFDELRRIQRQPAVPLNPINEDGEAVEDPTWLVDPGAGPEERTEISELRRTLQNHLDGLAVDYRMAILLVDVQGFDYAEAAGALGIPIGTLKSRLARGRLSLRNRLSGTDLSLPDGFSVNALH